MNTRQRESVIEWGGIDWVMIGLCLALVGLGWMMIFASEYNEDTFTSIFDFSKSYGKQLVWIGAAATVFLLTQLTESKLYQTLAIVLYGITVFVLIAVLFTTPINGASSWFDIGGFRFQPSEFGKTATCLALAAFLSLPHVRLQEFNYKLQALGIIFIPILLILLQSDAGSAAIYFLAFMVVLFRAGLDAWIYIMGAILIFLSIFSLMYDSVWGVFLFLLAGGAATVLQIWQKNLLLTTGYVVLWLGTSYLFWDEEYKWIFLGTHGGFLLIFLVFLMRNQTSMGFSLLGLLAVCILYASSVNYGVNNILEPHQQERIWVWLRPEKCDPQGPLYNLEQSKFAIGSGGMWGKGFLEGERTKLNYVPEQSTDFIYCTVGEEWGFWGSILVNGIFLGLLMRIVHVAERQRSLFAKYYAYGVAGILFFHVFINIGMTVGLVPVIGIPLPFISYGGSSLISFALMISLLIKLDKDRLSVFR